MTLLTVAHQSDVTELTRKGALKVRAATGLELPRAPVKPGELVGLR